MNKPILLYANPMEVKYVTYFPKYCIGMGASELLNLSHAWVGELVILFGCCGALKNLPTNQFYAMTDVCPSLIAHADGLVHDKKLADQIRGVYPRALLVDRETKLIADWCHKQASFFMSVRYIIDFCEHKVMPTGINHFWRIWQHYRMQKRFDKIIWNMR